jgi:hypothetical protein
VSGRLKRLASPLTFSLALSLLILAQAMGPIYLIRIEAALRDRSANFRQENLIRRQETE